MPIGPEIRCPPSRTQQVHPPEIPMTADKRLTIERLCVASTRRQPTSSTPLADGIISSRLCSAPVLAS